MRKPLVPPVPDAAGWGIMGAFPPYAVVFMRKIVILAILAALLNGCADFPRAAPAVGDPLATVKAKFGQPSATYPDGAGQVLEYATGPFGQQTWMARIGADGRLASFEQVLDDRKFATVRIGAATRDQILRTFGKPAETSRLALTGQTVWSYRYKESGVWNSLMHVHFDQAGIVRGMMNGPDPMYEKIFLRD